MNVVYYRTPHALSRWVLALLGAMAGLDLIDAILSVARMDLLDQWNAGAATNADLQASSDLQGGLAIVYLLAYVATGVVFLIWFHRLWTNVHWMAQGWGVRYRLKYSTASAVWSFILPILNLVRPYQIMRVAWDYNAPDEERGRHDILMGWWALWVVGNVLGQITFRVDDPETIMDLQLVSSLVGVVGAGLAMLVVHRQTRYQVDRVERGHAQAGVFS